jgi:hypothetical protein
MDVAQSVNRTVNLLAVSIVGLSGLAFLPEAFIEPELIDKVDDGALFVLGAAGVVWYLMTATRYARTVWPIVLLVLALLIKIFAVWAEFPDPEDVGDDFGGVILFVLGTGLVVYQYMRAPRVGSTS